MSHHICSRATTYPMSHHISYEPPHILWATTYPISNHISYEPPHILWANTSAQEPPHILWATTYPMSHHISYEQPHILWATTYPMSHHISYEPPHILYVFLNVQKFSVLNRTAFLWVIAKSLAIMIILMPSCIFKMHIFTLVGKKKLYSFDKINLQMAQHCNIT